MRIAILTISTSAARGERLSDASGDAIADYVATHPGDVVAARELVADDRAAIAARLSAWADADIADLILTTGGTGFAPTDVTPEATMSILDRQTPGLAEAMRVETARQTPLAWLSRSVAGIRRHTLIVNLPGSPRAVRECLAVLEPILPHAVAILTEAIRQHPAQE